MATKLTLDLAGKAGTNGTFSWLFTPTGITYYLTTLAYDTTLALNTPVLLRYNTYSHEAQVISTSPRSTLKVIDPDRPYAYNISINGGTWDIYAGNQEDSIFGAMPDGNRIDALGGSDTIDVRNNNTVYGGVGNDNITVQNSNTVHSGKTSTSSTDIDDLFDNDTIKASDANWIASGYGDDSVVGVSSNTIFAGAGNDQVHASDHSYIDAGSGNDTVDFDYYAHHSTVIGGDGQDSLVAGESDIVYGDGVTDTNFDKNPASAYGCLGCHKWQYGRDTIRRQGEGYL